MMKMKMIDLDKIVDLTLMSHNMMLCEMMIE